MYSFSSRIRYSECDSGGKLTLASLLNYFQDCSTFQSEDLRLGFEYLSERHLVWVLAFWQIVVLRRPGICEEVEIGTFPYEFKKCIGVRNFFMRTKEGEYLAKANSVWGLLNTETMKPTLPSADMLRGYRLESRLEMDYSPRKIKMPDELVREEPIVVKKHHLDTNLHVNNGQYIDMALEFLPEDFVVGQLRAEYKKQAWLGDVLYPYTAKAAGAYSIALRDENGEPYVNMLFLNGAKTAEGLVNDQAG